jgi:type II secretory pathway pseudopilin PulG
VAGPRIFNTSTQANQAAVRVDLSVIRQAIEEYRIINGKLPGKDGNEATFRNDLKPFLRGAFPVCPVGAINPNVRITTTAGGLGITGEASPTKGWHYHNKKGYFIVNWTGLSPSGVPYDQY